MWTAAILFGWHVHISYLGASWFGAAWLNLDPRVWFGLSGPRSLRWDHSHELVSKFRESRALVWLRHEVARHVFGWAPVYRHVSFLDSIRDKVVAHVDVLGSLAAGGFPVLL